MSLREVKGVGEKKEDALIEKGIKSVEQLSNLKPDELALILDMSIAKAKPIVSDAKTIVINRMVELISANEVMEERKKKLQRISTGSISLDRIIGGGIQTDAITALTGRFGVGKSQLGFQLCVNIVEQFNRKAVFVETEPNCFSPKRLLEMSNGKLDLEKDIFVIPARSISDPFKQYIAYDLIDKKAKEGFDLGLIVIDSFSAKFRSYYTGREMLSSRTQEIARHIGYLEYIASKYNTAIVLTVQKYGIPDQGSQLGARVEYGDDMTPSGGAYLLHSASVWIGLRHIATDRWGAVLFDSPEMPRAKTEFRITTEGVRDIE